MTSPKPGSPEWLEQKAEEYAKDNADGFEFARSWSEIQEIFIAGALLGIEAAAKVADKERKNWSRPGGVSCSSQQMQEYAKRASSNIAQAIRKLGKQE